MGMNRHGFQSYPDSTGSTAGCYPNPQEDVVLLRTETLLQTGKCEVV